MRRNCKKSRRPFNYYIPRDIAVGKNEYEEYNIELKEISSKLGYLTQHSMMILDKWKISRDKLSGELFFGVPDDIRIKAEFDELYINSKKMEINRDDLYELPPADNYNIEYTKYSYDRCNKKIDTFSISRVIEFK